MGSTRLSRKALADIHGKPMVVRVAERVALSGASEILVATDDDEIAQAVTAHGFEAQMTAPSHRSGTERIAEVIDIRAWPDDAIVLNVQGDEPLIDFGLITAVAEDLASDERAAMSTAACPIRDVGLFQNMNAVKVVCDRDGYALYFSRATIPFRSATAPENPDIYGYLHFGLYAYRAGFLRQFAKLPVSPIEGIESLEQLRALWHGHKIRVRIADVAPDRGVDTQDDLVYARQRFLDIAKR